MKTRKSNAHQLANLKVKTTLRAGSGTNREEAKK
jgi:hypothetical protein